MNLPMTLALVLLAEEEQYEQWLRHRRRRDRRIRREATLMPAASPWRHLYFSGDDQSLITYTGFDHYSFDRLHTLFKHIYYQYTPYSNDGSVRLVTHNQGRQRNFSSVDALGLVLAYFRNRDSMSVLAHQFGSTHSPCVLWLRFSRRILFLVLRQQRHAAVKMPSLQEIREYQRIIRENYPLLRRVYCFADGLMIPLQSCSDFLIQNSNYNGWKGGHFVKNVFVFVPKGTIIACSLNCPGSFHDSDVCRMGGIYDKLEEVHAGPSLGKCLMDSAFQGAPYIIKSARQLPVGANELQQAFFDQATSMRQSAEWGMRAFQGSFRRFKNAIIYEERGERKITLQLAVLLFNWRANTVGLNQIRTRFMPYLDREYHDVFELR
jgi:DDE superfamily endonuclease